MASTDPAIQAQISYKQVLQRCLAVTEPPNLTMVPRMLRHRDVHRDVPKWSR